MLGIAALALTVYAAYALWPWWIAGIVGGVVGIAHFVMVEMRRTLPTGGAMTARAVQSVLIFGAYTVAIYFVARWLLSLISN
jgi:hypothetical protein